MLAPPEALGGLLTWTKIKMRARARAQSWEDEDMPALLEDLGGALADNIRLLSSWDKYKKEVLSGSLDWTPMHTSDAFWAENAPHFEERDFQARAGRVGWGVLGYLCYPNLPLPPPCLAERCVAEAERAARPRGRGGPAPGPPGSAKRCMYDMQPCFARTGGGRHPASSQLRAAVAAGSCRAARTRAGTTRAGRGAQVLRVLLKLLETSRESRTLAVAASDLGRFIAAHPHGRNIVAGAPCRRRSAARKEHAQYPVQGWPQSCRQPHLGADAGMLCAGRHAPRAAAGCAWHDPCTPGSSQRRANPCSHVFTGGRCMQTGRLAAGDAVMQPCVHWRQMHADRRFGSRRCSHAAGKSVRASAEAVGPRRGARARAQTSTARSSRCGG